MNKLSIHSFAVIKVLTLPLFSRLQPVTTHANQDKDQRIFLYDRATIVPLERPEDVESTASATTTNDSSSTLFIPPAIDLPSEPQRPEPQGFNSHLEAASSSPLLQTITNFERQFMLALNKGEVLSEVSTKWVEDVQAAEDIAKMRHAALLAAKSNLQFHMDALSKTYYEGASRLKDQKQCHAAILDHFDDDLELLGRIQLHPALTPSTDSRYTLLDCVPVDKERALHEACQQSHRRMEAHEANMVGAWERLKAGVSKQQDDHETEHIHLSHARSLSSRSGCSIDEERGDHGEDGGQSSSIEWGGDWLVRAKKDAVDQELRLLELQKNYDTALAMAERQLSLNLDDANISMEAIQDLNALFTGQRGLMPDMLATDESLRKAVGRGREIASMSSKALNKGLKEIARLQNKIQEVQSWLRFMRAASDQKDDQFSHLEKIQRMPSAYEAFKNEIVRRCAYSSVFKAQVSEAVDLIAALRSREIVARDVFRHCHLVNLPVFFLEIAPGLCEQQPPHFDPMVKESNEAATTRGPTHLPNIQAADIGTTEEDARRAVRESSGDSEAETDQALKTDEEEGGQAEEILNSPEEESSNAENAHGLASLQYENALLRAEIIRLKQYLRDIGGSNTHSAAVAPVMGSVKGQRNGGDNVHTLKQSSDKDVSKGGEETSTGNSPIGSSCTGNISNRVHSAVAATSEVAQTPNLLITRSRSENEMCSALRSIERSATAYASADDRLPASWSSRTSRGSSPLPPYDKEDKGGVRWGGVAKLVDTALQRSREKFKRATMEVQLQVEENDSLHQAMKSAMSFRISFQSIIIDDLVLFLPSGDKNVSGERIYRAFHANCRNYYLSKENVRQVMDDGGKGDGAEPDFILGKVIHIEMRTAGESDDVEAKYFQPESGTSHYYVLTIVPWKDGPQPNTL